MMTRMSKATGALLLLLLISCSFFGCQGFNFGKNKPDSKDAKPRQEFTDDASTGTVTQMSSNQEDAMTCDAIMAKSLVKANEAKAKAEDERDTMATEKARALERVSQLQEALAAARTSHDAEMKAMDDAIKNVDDAIKKVKAEAEEQVAEANSKVEQVREEAEAVLKSTKEEHAKSLEALRVRQERQIKEIHELNDSNIDEILNEAHTRVKEYEDQMKDTNEKAKAKVAQAEEKSRQEKVLAEQRVEATKKEAEERIQKVTEESNAKIAAAESERDSQIAGMKKHMDEHTSRSAKEIDAAFEEAKNTVAQKEQFHKKEIENKETELKETQETSRGQIAALTAEIKDLKKEVEQMKNDLSEKTKELANWEDLHAKRGYCNLTHIGEDTLSAAASAAKAAANRASLVKEKSFKVAQKVADQATVAAAPGVKKSRDLYDLHLKQHVDEKILPVHKKHVGPALVVLGRYWKKAMDGVQTGLRKIYSLLVSQFTKTCPKVLNGLMRMNKKMDVAVPSFLINHVDDSCANPERTVSSFLRAAGLLFILIFRSWLWRTTKKIILFPFRLAWYFTPLRLFIQRYQGDSLNKNTRTVKTEKVKNGQSK